MNIFGRHSSQKIDEITPDKGIKEDINETMIRDKPQNSNNSIFPLIQPIENKRFKSILFSEEILNDDKEDHRFQADNEEGILDRENN